MAERKAVRVERQFTPVERSRWEKQVAQIEAEKPEINKWMDLVLAEQDALRQAIATALQSARTESGLTLSELQERTGIDQSQLSRLMNSGGQNPTVNTLQRIAIACGKRLVVSLLDE